MVTLTHTVSSSRTLLEYFEQQIECAAKELEGDLSLLEVCRYALLNRGKRVRPLIVLAVGDLLGDFRMVKNSALAVEYFHTCSLLVDDLPCMDNDSMRREKPTAHVVYGEAPALLASYGLLVASFEEVRRNAAVNDMQARLSLAMGHTIRAAGLSGATTGQYRDLYEPNLSEEVIKSIFYEKTVVLFEVAFILGWIFGGGDLATIDQIKELGRTYGFAFQLADDFTDLDQDESKERSLNIVYHMGRDRARTLFNDYLASYRQLLTELNLDSEPLLKIASALEEHAALE